MGDELSEFRAAALHFLETNARHRVVATQAGWGIGSDSIGLLDAHADRAAEAAALARSREWRRLVFDHGFGWAGGPVALGGGGRNPLLDEEYRRLEVEFDVPDQQPFATGTHLVAPALLAHGSPELQAKYLPGIFRGELVVCQLLSEPEAGSDLAALRTRAVRDGDHWVVTGQKVWSSQAHLSQVGQLLVRTDPDAPKHQGITMFVLDMDTPGVTVRPLRQMTGETHFNEVFLDEVRIPDANRVGELGSGWRAVMATLMSERASVGSGANNSAIDPVARLRDMAEHLDRANDPIVRQRLAALHTNAELRRFLIGRHEAAMQAGKAPGAEGSILKLLFGDQAVRCAALASELLGPSVLADSGEWGTYAWGRWITGSPMMRIAGGTDEIQRNTLAERLLGLPREPS
ncbi:MAG: acyl-CoA dehydrogenase family protein [Actinomycetota bacterium]|nr:acyl-CoA dehydrogenase family protein [Actinomycetota bacterium]